MDRFQAMQVFTRVVELTSFTKAADRLGMPRTTVTTAIQHLESLLHVRLLNRTTRRLSLTPDGAAYYERCVRILADIDETESLFQHVARKPNGRLRIDVPTSIGRLILLPKISEFYARYPDIELVMGLGDRKVDLVQEAVDCVIRVGELQDSSMIARRIGTFESVTCAAPTYLEQHGTPICIDDLQQHQAVHYFSSRTGRNMNWDFMVDGEIIDVKIKGKISVNDSESYLMLALNGFGLIQAPRFMLMPHLESGALREVLSQWHPASMPISVIYLANRHLSPKVRAFVDWVAELFASCPLFSGRDADMLQGLTECTFGIKPDHTTIHIPPRTPKMK